VKSTFRCINIRLLTGLWLLLASVFLSLGLVKFWTDSEMWAVSASKFFFEGGDDYFLGIKPLFHLMLWINYQISDQLLIYPIDLSRFLWGLLALGIMVLCDRILRAEGFAKSYRILFQMTLFGTTTWLYRASEVRSDIAATAILLVVLYFLRNSFKAIWQKLFLLLMGGLLCALITPKSLFLFLGSLPVLLFLLPELNEKKLKGAALAVIGALFFFGALLFHEAFLESLKFFFRQFDSPTAVPYFSKIRLMHLVRSFKENPHLGLLVFGVLALGLKNGLWKGSQRSRPYFFSAIALFVILWSYPDPLPFFISSYLPVLILYSFICLKQFIDGLPNQVIVGLTLLLFINFLFGVSQVFRHNNFQQRSMANWSIQEFKDRDEILVFDPTGFYTPRNGQHWFLGPSMAPEDFKNIFGLIEVKRPEVIFYTHKLVFLEPNVREFLSEKYFQWAPYIFLSTVKWPSERGSSCAEVEEQLKKDLFARRVQSRKSIYPVSALITSTSGQRRLVEWASQEQLCESFDSGIGDIIVFGTKPPGSPGDNLVELFRYDPFF